MQARKKQQGFTLIELMIVVAIIGILAAVALPIYQDFIARSQVAEGMASAGAMKTSITEFNSAQGAWPAAGVYDTDPLVANAGRYTLSVTHNALGVITVTLLGAAPVSQLVRDYQFTLTPVGGAAGAAITSWNCAPVGALLQKYLPSGCIAPAAAPAG